MTDDFFNEDRRRVVNAGVRSGRGAQMADMRTVADLWTTNLTPSVIATRGELLALMHLRFWDHNQGPEAFVSEALFVIESDSEGRATALISFDMNDIDTAIAELDARYLAGEAAAHARTWSVIAELYAAFNRQQPPAGRTGSPSTIVEVLPLDPTTSERNLPHRLGPHAGSPYPHRKGASAQQFRSGSHQCFGWDLARGLRRGVANDTTADCRRRPGRPLRTIRRDRPRRRARPLR